VAPVLAKNQSVWRSRPSKTLVTGRTHGTDAAGSLRLVGGYVGRILKGEKPADLPVQQATKIELVINLTTAKALALDVPEKLLATADELIK
jgi:putative ABC transport system substrate-binding protein